MKAVQREDFDGLAQLLIKAGHLFNFLWVGHKAGVQLLIASVNIWDHQHHDLPRFSPFSFCPAPLVVWRLPHSTHIQLRSTSALLVVAAPPDARLFVVRYINRGYPKGVSNNGDPIPKAATPNLVHTLHTLALPIA